MGWHCTCCDYSGCEDLELNRRVDRLACEVLGHKLKKGYCSRCFTWIYPQKRVNRWQVRLYR